MLLCKEGTPFTVRFGMLLQLVLGCSSVGKKPCGGWRKEVWATRMTDSWVAGQWRVTATTSSDTWSTKI